MNLFKLLISVMMPLRHTKGIVECELKVNIKKRTRNASRPLIRVIQHVPFCFAVKVASG